MPEFDVVAYLEKLAKSTSCEECKVPLPKLGENDRYIFISYSHKDYKQVYADLADLYAADIPFWYDEGLYSKAGINWDDVVRQKMTDPNCAGIIFYMSQNLFTSRSIQTEIRIALGEDGNTDLPQIRKLFFAVNLESDVVPSAILRSVNFFDMFAEEEDTMSAISQWMHTLGKAFPDKPTYLPISAPNHKERLISNIDTMFGIKPNYNPYAFGNAIFRSGNGVIEFPNGSIYDGAFSDGIFNGYGKMTWSDGATYEGEWKQGQRHGKCTQTFTDGTTYEGNMLDGQRHGYGKMIFPNGAVYEGQWKKDIRHGQGKITFPNGAVYEGEWEDGKRHGQGKITSPDDAVYEGEWKSDRPNGHGKYIYPDGASRSGIWDGIMLLEGEGVMYNDDDSIYDGQIKNNLPHGIGTLTLPDGTVQSGRFENGEYIGPAD